MEINSQQSKFEGWAIVNVLGHQQFAGYVTTEHFGQTVLFRVVSPDRESRTRVSKEGEYMRSFRGYSYAQEGWQISEGPMPATERYIGAGSIYTLEPSTREKVVAALDEASPRPVVEVTDAEGKPIEQREESYF